MYSDSVIASLPLSSREILITLLYCVLDCTFISIYIAVKAFLLPEILSACNGVYRMD